MKQLKNRYLLKMEIINKFNDFYRLQISLNKEKSILEYSPEKSTLIIKDNNKLGELLKNKEIQIQKILRTKRIDTFYIGFKLNFVLHDEIKNTIDLSKDFITIIDKRNNQEKIYKSALTNNTITKLYTDGSYLEQKNKGGFAIFIKYKSGKNKLFKYKTKAIGNNLIELLAVIKGINILKKERKIRIITDSRYVIKGATEWTQNWKINNWKTANGEKVKNKRYWKKLDKLANKKYLEFEWVKAHSNHLENTICDKHAKEIANK